MINTIINVIALLVVAIPVAYAIFDAATANSHNAKLNTLKARAKIIVDALDQNPNIETSAIRQLAGTSILSYAKEVSTKLSPEQADEYIGAAMKAAGIVEQVVPETKPIVDAVEAAAPVVKQTIQAVDDTATTIAEGNAAPAPTQEVVMPAPTVSEVTTDANSK